MAKSNTSWEFDKRIPVTVIVMLAFHTMGAFWYAARLDARVEALEKKLSNNSQVLQRLARVEEGVEHIQSDIVRMLNRDYK